MHPFQNMSIRRKQTLIMTLTSSVVLLLACAAFVTYDTVTFRRELVESVSVLAVAIGNNCAAAIDFNDPKTAEETLAALHANTSIISSCVYSRNGKVFAAYQRDPSSPFVFPPRHNAGQVFAARQLHLFRPVTQQGVVVGAIFVASDLTEISSRLMRYMDIVGLVFLVSLLVAFVLSSQLQRLVSDPILRLAQVARSVALEKNYSVRAAKHSNDELGQLVDGFNEMLAQIQARDTALQTARDNLEKRVEERTGELETIHKQLVEASRLGGMAEIATNVLHNVGNVLNSVNISSGLIVERVKKSKASALSRVVGLLHEHTHDLADFIANDQRGKFVPAHLAQLTDHFITDQAAIIDELESLRRNVEHIKEIVAMQQNYARVGGVKEVINLLNLVEDSMRINEGALTRHRVEVIRDFDVVPPMNVEKHKILQILVNLMRNAKYACEESGRADKRLTVRVANGDGRVRISVADNGVGILPENLARIFNHGFTTRAGGHGFGLHSGALAAKEMGGSLTVLSEGPGRGAAFTLELPCPAQEYTHE
ncbi:MAG TPA: ATP-binding protein [Candidatus Baltobacteraceae bacterium]|jgi:signal transduction histidine kinase|nr:ATP-binding protein [Candidatus Baltobacteraceae bacterium]